MERIIIDIRGNGGGEDTVWLTLYSKIVAKPVSFRLKIDDYALPKEEMIARGITDQKKETNPLLLKYHLFTIVDKTETLEPLDSSIRFTGKIIVLAENIYSSAGSSIVIPNADPRDNIISIGRKAGYFLGVGFSPLNFELPHSQFPYRIAPSINVTGAVKLADLTHDRYEIELPYSIQEFIDREKYNGNIFSKGFLLHYDPFIKKALAL